MPRTTPQDTNTPMSTQMPTVAESVLALAHLRAYLLAQNSARDHCDSRHSTKANRAKLQSSVDRPGEMELTEAVPLSSELAAIRRKHNRAIGSSLHESAVAANALCVMPAKADLLMERRLGHVSSRRHQTDSQMSRIRLESAI